jgi:hypothetical protein
LRNNKVVQSKIANLFFTLKLQRRLAKAGQTTVSTSAHPGYAQLQKFMSHPRDFVFILFRFVVK